jgi:hypothetical protein
MIQELIDQQLLKNLIGKSHFREFKEFHAVLDNLETEGYDFEFIKEFVSQWVEDSGYIEYENNPETRIIYTITQWYTFEMRSKTLKLLRGIQGRKDIIDKIIKSEHITTNKLTSFTQDRDTAEVFALKSQEKKGLLFETLVKSENVLMTHNDWFSLLDNPVSGDEEEFVVLNLNNKTYPIKILGIY